MRSIFLAGNGKWCGVAQWVKGLFLFLLTSACLASSLPAGGVGQASLPDMMDVPYSQDSDSQGIRNGAMASGDACPTRNDVMTSGDACPTMEELITKTKTLQMPFIANNGQVDEQVRFYAKTFGGTVFVTKDGEIVYALPSGRDVPAGASQEAGRGHEAGEQGSSGAEEQGGMVVPGWHGQAPLVRADAEFVEANVYSPLLHTGKANCPPDRVFANALLAAYLPGLQKKTTQRVVSTPATSNPGVLPANNNPHSAIQNPQSSIRGVALKETIVGAKIGGITGEQPAVTTVNYFTGNDQSKWKTNVPTFDMVNLGEVYQGIELSLKAYSNNVEKLFCVKPGASPDVIKVQLDGSKSLRVNQDGQLEVDTELGQVKFTRPIAYQEIDGKRVEVECKYTIAECVNNLEFGFWNLDCFPYSAFRIPQSTTSDFPNPKSPIQNPKSEYCFTVASYDKTHDLIIDPLLASTFLGGSSWDEGRSLALDTSGNVYVTGRTSSPDFPTTSGAYDTSYNVGGVYGYGDVFVSKLNSGLTSLLASTYLGGSADDYGTSLALDTSGNVYVTGYTWSTNFPTTSGAYDTSFDDYYDVFVSKLNSGLTSLLASTFLGGSVGDGGDSLALDPSGNVYVTGNTWSTNFPTTSGAYDTSYNVGSSDVFVSKLDSGLTSLLASTLLGGGLYGRGEGGKALALDTSGNVYVTGKTDSTDFPTTSGAYDTSFNGGYLDVFVSKLNSGLTSLLASTFLGGSDDDYGNSITLDTSGNAYVTGLTNSYTFPTTGGAYDTSFNISYDVFVSKLDSGLTSLLASTYLGGSSADYGNSLALDTSGNVYVTGYTGSTNFPTTSGAYDISMNGYYDNIFVSKLNSGLTSLLASTYLGGAGYNGEYGKSLALDTSGNVYVTGCTSSTNFPTTSGACDTSYNGGSYDVFVSKLDGNLSADISCTYSISPTSQSFGSSGGTGSVGVTASSSSCSWTAVSNAAWITVTSGGSGTGNGTVAYSVSTNTGTSARTGTMTIAGKTFTVTQEGIVACKAKSITAAPKNLSLKKNGNGDVTITVKGDGNCLVEGATVTATISGTGNQIIDVSPASQATDANGQAIFAMNAKDKKGTAVIRFRASGLSKSTTVKVKVR